VAAVHYTFTHKQYTEYRERNIHNNKTKKKHWEVRAVPVFAIYTLAFSLQLREKLGKPSVSVVEKCPDIPVAAVQYTFTHKQYTEQHNETEYTERNVHNNRILRLLACSDNNIIRSLYFMHNRKLYNFLILRSVDNP
jgi:hypothetical protein